MDKKMFTILKAASDLKLTDVKENKTLKMVRGSQYILDIPQDEGKPMRVRLTPTELIQLSQYAKKFDICLLVEINFETNTELHIINIDGKDRLMRRYKWLHTLKECAFPCNDEPLLKTLYF